MHKHNHNNKRRKDNRVAAIERRFAPASDNNQIYNQRLITSYTITTSAGGTINTVDGNNPSGANEWASLIALYDEFRVVGVRIRICPVQTGSVVNINMPVVIVYDNDDSTALTSVGAGYEYDTAVITNAIWTANQNCGMNGNLLELAWARPTSGRNTAIAWVDVAAPGGSLGSIKWYATGLTATTTYFVVWKEFFLEFRGRR